MKHLILIFSILALSLSGCSAKNSDSGTKTGNDISNTQDNGSSAAASEENASGESGIKIEEAALSDILAEKDLTMVNVWATFCGPCIKEMPDLGEISAEYADKDFQIVGIVIDVFDENAEIVDEQIEVAKQIVKKTGANYLHIVPDMDTINAFLSDITAVPTTFFLDGEGNRIGETMLGGRSKAEWIKEIDDRLKK